MQVRGFVNEVYERYGMRPVVPFEFPIELGDIGTIANDGIWRPITTARQRFYGLPGRIGRSRDSRLIWEASGRGVTFTMFGRGERSALVPHVVDARPRAEVEFRSTASYLFAAREVTVRTALEMDDLIDKIRIAYHLRRRTPEEGRWYRDYAFVFAVGDAQRFTAIFPKRTPTRIAVMSRGPVGPPESPRQLAGGVDLGAATGELVTVHQERAPGRFYRAYRLRNDVLRRWREEPWTTTNGNARCEAPVPTFEETFLEV